jgi:hypothetical protein
VGQWRALPQTIDQARHAWPLPTVPTVVLTSGTPLHSWPLATDEDMQKWLVSHNGLVAQIPGAKHMVFPRADHLNILKEEAVVEQIARMVDAERAKKK